MEETLTNEWLLLREYQNRTYLYRLQDPRLEEYIRRNFYYRMVDAVMDRMAVGEAALWLWQEERLPQRGVPPEVPLPALHEGEQYEEWRLEVRKIEERAVMLGDLLVLATRVPEGSLATRVEMVRRLLEGMSPEARMEALRPFCRHCGDRHAEHGGFCQCWNDE